MPTPNRRKKILFFAEGLSMSHFVRPAALAETLDPAEWDVYFWTPKRYHPFLRRTFCGLGDLPTMNPKEFLDLLARGRVWWSKEMLRRYVQDDLKIIREIKPDLVIGDLRLSLCVSAPVCGVPFASISNAYWSPYWKQPAIAPELPMMRWVPPPLLKPIFWLLRPALFAYFVKPINDIRRSYDLSPLPHLQHIHTMGDLVFYPDVPDYIPLPNAPAHHHFIGTCPWVPSAPKPAWWDEVMNSPQPKIFVDLGSSSPVKIGAALEAASSLPVHVLLSTHGRSHGPIPANIHSADLLPYVETLRQSAAVITHGGAGGVYPALAAGTPVLAIPSHFDTHVSTDLLEKSGAGLGVRSEYASPRKLRMALERLLSEVQFKEAAQKWAGVFARYDTKTIFPEILKRWFAERDSLGRRAA